MLIGIAVATAGSFLLFFLGIGLWLLLRGDDPAAVAKADPTEITRPDAATVHWAEFRVEWLGPSRRGNAIVGTDF